MGPVISRQPHPVVKVPIPTGSSHSPADEVCVSLCVRQRDFFMAENRGDHINEKIIYIRISNRRTSG